MMDVLQETLVEITRALVLYPLHTAALVIVVALALVLMREIRS